MAESKVADALARFAAFHGAIRAEAQRLADERAAEDQRTLARSTSSKPNEGRP